MPGIGSSHSHAVVIGTLSLLLFAGACHRGGGAAERSAVPRSAPNVITQEELDGVTYATVLDAIRHLRPQMLRRRGANTINGQVIETPSVFLDDRYLGPIERLQHLAPNTIGVIRYLSAAEAQYRWGFGHPAGVILLSSREYPPPPND